MRAEGAPGGFAIHASAVAIEGRALLICGRSGSGKSRLAIALIAASTSRRRIRLIGDDRILLIRSDRRVVARSHPRIAGFVERRGLGLVAMPWHDRAPVGGVVALDDQDGIAASPWVENLPSIRLVSLDEPDRARTVLSWWQIATNKRQCRPDVMRVAASPR